MTDDEISHKREKYNTQFENRSIPNSYMGYVQDVDAIVKEYNYQFDIDLVAKYDPDTYRYEILYDDIVLSFFGFGYDDMEHLLGQRYGSRNFEGGIRGGISPYGDIDADVYKYHLIRKELDTYFRLNQEQINDYLDDGEYDIELKDNECQMTFSCLDSKDTECVYFFDRKNTGQCEFAEDYSGSLCYCRSAIAVVNKMTVKLKRMGLGK